MRSLQNCRHRPSDLAVVSCRLFRLLIEGFGWLNTQPSFLNILPSILILVRSIWTRTCFAAHQLGRYLRVRPLGSGLSQGGLAAHPAFAARLLFRNLLGASFGVWPFLGCLAALPALPPVCRFATVVIRLSGSGLSWGASRPSLRALQLSRGFSLLFPRLSGLSILF